jgi:hypothetical protein
VNKCLRILLCVSCLLAVQTDLANAGSLGDFFKKIGISFTPPPQKHPTPARKNPSRPKGVAETLESPSPVPSPSAEPTVRTGSIVTEARNSKRDVPYGIPVADKPGFVTSPYSPTEGIVDVRGIPSGTEVRDPYTGKVFLRP